MGQAILSGVDSRRHGLGRDGHGQICPGFPVGRSVGQNGLQAMAGLLSEADTGHF